MLFPWILVTLPLAGSRSAFVEPQSAPGPLLALYQELHAHPELSYSEESTSKRVADELRQAGFAVTEHLGRYADPKRKGFGVVGVLANGKGPTVLVRTDMD